MSMEEKGGRETTQGQMGHHLPLPLKVQKTSLFVHVLLTLACVGPWLNQDPQCLVMSLIKALSPLSFS